MITPSESMPLLVEACPSFMEAWRKHLDENGNDFLYIAAGDFAHHLLALYAADNLSVFPAVAAVIERLHIEGSPWVKEFATVGVLEGVQNVWSNNNVDPERFDQFLGPESKRMWQSLNDFWSGKVPYVGADG